MPGSWQTATRCTRSGAAGPEFGRGIAVIPSPRHYGVRRVNPFEGVLQVVETDSGRAYSPNGETWQVQVIAERPGHTWRSFSAAPAVVQYFNFGLWDAVAGLHRVPANPVMDIGGMTAAAESVCSALAALDSQVPFALIDRFECWAADGKGNPVALLATTEDRATIDALKVDRWHACRPADHAFEAPSQLARDIPAQDDRGPRQHATMLERLVNETAPRRRWFERRDDGSGLPLEQPVSKALAAHHFPSLGLRTDWTREQDRELVADYLDWLAPRLLLLQHIADSERAALERAACRHAERLAAGFRLLPRILDGPALEAARVEARLRRSAR